MNIEEKKELIDMIKTDSDNLCQFDWQDEAVKDVILKFVLINLSYLDNVHKAMKINGIDEGAKYIIDYFVELIKKSDTYYYSVDRFLMELKSINYILTDEQYIVFLRNGATLEKLRNFDNCNCNG